MLNKFRQASQFPETSCGKLSFTLSLGESLPLDMGFHEMQVKVGLKERLLWPFRFKPRTFPSCLTPAWLTFHQTQRKTQILILCNQTGVEDLGSPKYPILDSPGEGDKVQVKKSPFCKCKVSSQALCLPQPMVFVIESCRYMPLFFDPAQQKS